MDEQQPDGVYRFDHSLTAQADRLRKEAREAPPGVKRDQLLKRAAQLEDDVRMKAMVRPPPAEITSTWQHNGIGLTDVEIFELSFDIAWSVLERTGELGDANETSLFLFEYVAVHMSYGERRSLIRRTQPLMLTDVVQFDWSEWSTDRQMRILRLTSSSHVPTEDQKIILRRRDFGLPSRCRWSWGPACSPGRPFWRTWTKASGRFRRVSIMSIPLHVPNVSRLLAEVTVPTTGRVGREFISLLGSFKGAVGVEHVPDPQLCNTIWEISRQPAPSWEASSTRRYAPPSMDPSRVLPDSGVVSCVVELPGGGTIETGMIGKDGQWGASLALDDKTSLKGPADDMQRRELRNGRPRPSPFAAGLINGGAPHFYRLRFKIISRGGS